MARAEEGNDSWPGLATWTQYWIDNSESKWVVMLVGIGDTKLHYGLIRNRVSKTTRLGGNILRMYNSQAVIRV